MIRGLYKDDKSEKIAKKIDEIRKMIKEKTLTRHRKLLIDEKLFEIKKELK